VSNDPHLRRLGASIDAHDEVIRLNNFYSRGGGTANYGDKVTYLVSNTAHSVLHNHGKEGDFVREFAQVHRCMLRYEPAFRCGKVCHKHNTGTLEYTKSELDTNYTNFGCPYIPKAAYTASMSALSAAQAADGPKGPKNTASPSTGALAVFALAPSCAKVHSYDFTVPKPPYRESRVHDMEGEHEAFRAVSPKPCGISSASPVMLSVEAVMHHHGFCVSLAVCL
jgi:hypothetical protein